MHRPWGGVGRAELKLVRPERDRRAAALARRIRRDIAGAALKHGPAVGAFSRVAGAVQAAA